MSVPSGQRARCPRAVAVVAAGLLLAGPGSVTTTPVVTPALRAPVAELADVTVTPDTVTALAVPPTSTAVPADGRLRGNGFAANIVGVATGPRTATQRAGPGQQLWRFGITATTTAPAGGGAPVTLTATLTVASTTVPVALPAPPANGGTVGPVWYQASLPATAAGADVVLSLSAAGSTQSFSFTQMARTGPSPTVSYRDPTNPAVATKPAQAIHIPDAFQPDSPFADGVTAFPIDVTLDTVTLGYYAPDAANEPSSSVDGAWMWVTLDSNAATAADQNPYGDPYLIVDRPVPATAISLTVPGSPARNPTVVAGGGGDKGTTNGNFDANPTVGFPDTYLFSVPANLTTATLTVTPGPIRAAVSSTPLASGTATPTPAGANAAFNINLPAATSPAPPVGAATKPGTLDAATTVHNSPSATPSHALLRAPSVPTSPAHVLLDAFLIVLALAALVVMVIVAVIRSRRRAAPAGPAGGSAPPWAPQPPSPQPPPAAPTPDPEPPAGNGWPPKSAAWGPPAAGPSPPDVPTGAGPITSHLKGPEPTGTIPADQPPPPASPSQVGGLSKEAGGPSRPDLPASFPPPDLPAPAIRVLGAVRLEGWSNPPTGASLTELAVYLAVRNRPVTTDVLRTRLSPRSDIDFGKETIRVYCSKLRNHLDPGAELVSGRGGYQLDGVTTDLATFATLTATTTTTADRDVEIGRLGAALALVTGPPLAGTDYRWAPAETATIATPVRDAALRVCDLTTETNPLLARWACHQALLARPLDQTLAASALTAAKASDIPGALADEWAAIVERLGAAGIDIDPKLEAHYRRLVDDSRARPPGPDPDRYA